VAARFSVANKCVQQLETGRVDTANVSSGKLQNLVVQMRAQGRLQVCDLFDAEIGLQ
jgi:hypothetical protein